MRCSVTSQCPAAPHVLPCLRMLVGSIYNKPVRQVDESLHADAARVKFSVFLLVADFPILQVVDQEAVDELSNACNTKPVVLQGLAHDMMLVRAQSMQCCRA